MIILDLESVPNKELLDSREWLAKKKRVEAKGDTLTDDRAGLDGVFGQAICFCATACEINSDGVLVENEQLNIIDDDEEGLLEESSDFMFKYSNDFLVAHNGFGFDFPFFLKRLLAHKLPIPPQLLSIVLKPWERMLVDTMDIMKFGQWGSATSLDIACLLLGVESPKVDFDSSSVWERWKNGEEKYILDGCTGDTRALKEVYDKLRLQRLC